jgi:hypothetical protein
MKNPFETALRFALAALVAAAALTLAGIATAAPVSPDQFTCGVTVFTSCNQTAHFSTVDEQLTPVATTKPSNCPAFVLNDYGSLLGTGNGVEHSIVNNEGDGRFTSTFTGTATITPYLDPDLTIRDPNALPYTGHLTEWFGGSFKRNNIVSHDTFHFTGADANGNPLNITVIDQANTNAANPFGPPHSFTIAGCG